MERDDARGSMGGGRRARRRPDWAAPDVRTRVIVALASITAAVALGGAIAAIFAMRAGVL